MAQIAGPLKQGVISFDHVERMGTFARHVAALRMEVKEDAS